MEFIDYFLLGAVLLMLASLIVLTVSNGNRNKPTGKILISTPVSKGIKILSILLGSMMILIFILFAVDAYNGEDNSLSPLVIMLLNLINIYNFTNKVVVTSDGIGNKDMFNNIKVFYKWSDIEYYKWIGNTQLQLKVNNKKGKEVSVTLNIPKEYQLDISDILAESVFK